MSAQTNQWLQLYAEPWESDQDALRRLARQQGLTPAQTQALLDEHGSDDTQELAQEAIDYSGYLPEQSGSGQDSEYISDPDIIDSLGRGKDLLDVGYGQTVAGPVAGFLENTLGWEAGADWARAYGEEVSRENLEEAAKVAPAKSRAEILEEDPTSLYALTPEDWPTFGQMAEQAPSSFAAATGALATAIPAGILGGPVVGALVGMGSGNFLSSLQVGGEAYSRAKEEPSIRRALGIREDIPFAELDPISQSKVQDLATKVSTTSTYNRLFNAGALEMASYIPYGPFWARYLLDVGLGTASEEIDRRMYATDVIENLVKLGVPEEKIPQLREEILARGPTQRETLLQAFAMEATFGAPFAAIEGLAGDHRVDPVRTATKEQLAVIKQIQQDDIKARQEEFKNQDEDYMKKVRLQVQLRREQEKHIQEMLKTDKARAEGIMMLDYKDPRDLARSPEETALYSTVKGKKPVIEGKGTGKQMKGARASGAQPGQPKKVRTSAGEFNIIDSKDKLSAEDRSRVKDIENQQRKNKKDIDDFLNRTDDFPMTEEGLDALDDLRYERARLEHERAKIMAPTADGGKKLLAKTKKELDVAKKRVDANKKRRGPQEAKERLSKAGMGIKPDTDPSVDIPVNETYAAGLLGFKDKEGNVNVEAYRSIFPDDKPEDTVINLSKTSGESNFKDAPTEVSAAQAVAQQHISQNPGVLTPFRAKNAARNIEKALPGLKGNLVVFDTIAETQAAVEAMKISPEKAEGIANTSEAFVHPDMPDKIFLNRELLRGQNSDEAIARMVEVVYHEASHRGTRKAYDGKYGPNYRKLMLGIYKDGMVKKWIDSPDGSRYAVDFNALKGDKKAIEDAKIMQAEEYVAVVHSEKGALDPTVGDVIEAFLNDVVRGLGITKKVSPGKVKQIAADVQQEFSRREYNIIWGTSRKAAMAQAATGKEGEEDVSQSRISDYDRFVSFGGKPPLKQYDRPIFDAATAPKKTAQDAVDYVDNSILKAMRSKVWPEQLVKDLANFDKFPKAFQDSFRKSMKSGLRKREQELANAVLVKGREAYLQKKKGNVTPDTSAPKGFESGGAKWKELVDDVPKFARTTPEIQRATRQEALGRDKISQSKIKYEKEKPRLSRLRRRQDRLTYSKIKGQNSPASVPLGGLRRVGGAEHEQALAEINEDLQLRYGTIGHKPDPKVLQHYNLDPLIGNNRLEEYLAEKGFVSKYFSYESDPEKGIEFVLPNLQQGYSAGNLWIYDPRVEAASFQDADYTKAWRLAHELGHAVSERYMQERYGDSARDGRLGVPMTNLRGKPPKQITVELPPLTLAQAQRAVEWEDTAFRAQRHILEDLGVTIPDEKFAYEYNGNIKGALYRAITGRFDDPATEGWRPFPEIADTKSVLRTLEQTEFTLADAMGREPTKGINLDTWSPVSDQELRSAVDNVQVPDRPKRRPVKKTDKTDADFSFSRLPASALAPDAKISFSRLKGEPFKKTRTAYKLFRTLKTKPGNLYPLFIGRTKPIKEKDFGVWFEAENIPTKGFADRPGWHSGEIPVTQHLRKKDGTIDPTRVWAEVEIPDDVDWQSVADTRKTKDIKDEVPLGGNYRFAAPSLKGASWRVSGAIKIKRVLTFDQANKIASELGAQESDLSYSKITEQLTPEARERMQSGWRDLISGRDTPDLSTAGKRIKYLKEQLGDLVSAKRTTPFTYRPDGSLDINFSKLDTAKALEKLGPMRWVWHGTSRRELEGGKFSLKFLLSGEGHLRFGWGLYFTEKQAIADWYRDKDVARKAYNEKQMIGEIDFTRPGDINPTMINMGGELRDELGRAVFYDDKFNEERKRVKIPDGPKSGNYQWVWLRTRSVPQAPRSRDRVPQLLKEVIEDAQKRTIRGTKKLQDQVNKNPDRYESIYENYLEKKQQTAFQTHIDNRATFYRDKLEREATNLREQLKEQDKIMELGKAGMSLDEKGNRLKGVSQEQLNKDYGDLQKLLDKQDTLLTEMAGYNWLIRNKKAFEFEAQHYLDEMTDAKALNLTGGVFKSKVPGHQALLDLTRDFEAQPQQVQEALKQGFTEEEGNLFFDENRRYVDSIKSGEVDVPTETEMMRDPDMASVDFNIAARAMEVLRTYQGQGTLMEGDAGYSNEPTFQTDAYELYFKVADYFRYVAGRDDGVNVDDLGSYIRRGKKRRGGTSINEEYSDLARYYNNEGKRRASMYFDSLGIPGLQFLSEGSRIGDREEGMFNNVLMWNEDSIGETELAYSRLRNMSQAQEDYIKPTYNSFLKQIPKPKIDDYEKVYGKGFVKDFFETTEPNYRALSAPVNNPLDALANDISMSALKMEMDMRRQQIDKLPEGSNMRIEAIRDMHRMYMLNPLNYNEWKKSKYAKELKDAPPEEFSFSKLFKNMKAPTKEELALATDLLEKGQIMMDPALFRAMMGDAPKAISIVTPFMVKMRDKVLNGKTTDRMLFKALFMTSASQGMSGNSPFSSFTRSGGARQMPTKTSSTWGTEKTVRSPMNLYGLVDAINDEAGRGIYEGYPEGKLTTDMVIDWWNKTPLAHVSDIPFAKAVYPDEPDMTFPVNKDPKLAHTDESIFEDLSYIRDELPNGKKIRTNRAVGVELAKRFMNDGYKVVYTHGLKMKPGDSKPRVIENPEYTAWREATKTKDHPLPEYHGFFDGNGNFQLTYKDAPETGDIATARTVKKDGKNHKKFITQTVPDRWLVEVTRKNGEVESRPLGENFNIWFRDPKDQVNPNVKTGAIYVPRFYNQDDGKIRAEDGIAYWLSTPDGQKLLKFVDVARKFKGKKSITVNGKKLTYDDWYKQIVMLSRRGVDIRTAMGDDRLMQIITGKKKESLKRGKGRYAWDIHELTDYINDMAAKAPETIGKKYGVDSLTTKKGDTPEDHINKAFARLEFAKSIGEEVQTQHQVAVGKEGWNKHHYGLGDLPTVDAIEMNILLAGSTSLNWAETPIATGDIGDPEQFLPGGPGEPMTYDPDAPKLKVQGHWRQQLIKRMGMLSRPKDYDFGPLAKYMRKPSGKQYSGEEIMKGRMLQFYENIIYKVPPVIDENGTVKKAGVKHDVWKNVDDDLVYHFVHHWMWDRAKGVGVKSMWPSGNLKDGFVKAIEGEIGAVESTFRPGIYQAMIKDWFTLTADETRDHQDVLSMSKMAMKEMRPGELGPVVSFSGKLKNVINSSRLPGVSPQDYDDLWIHNHQLTVSDRMAVGEYQWFNPNNPTPLVLMTGGLGHGLFQSNIDADAVWAGQTPNVTTTAYRKRDYFDAPFMDIVIQDHDTHFGNSKMHYILTQEVNDAIKQGIVTRQQVNERILWILNNPATAVGQNTKGAKRPEWKAGPEALGSNALEKGLTTPENYSYAHFGIPEQDAAGNAIQAEIDNNFKIKIKGNGSDMKTRLLKAKGKDLWAKYNAYASLNLNDDATFFSRNRFWQIMMNILPMTDKAHANYRDRFGRSQYDLPDLFPTDLIQHIIDQTTDFPGAPKGSMVGIFKLDDNWQPVSFAKGKKYRGVHPITGQKLKEDIGEYKPQMNVDFGQKVVNLSGKYADFPYYYRGRMVATFENGIGPEIWADGPRQKDAWIHLYAKKKEMTTSEYLNKFAKTEKGQRDAVKYGDWLGPGAHKLDATVVADEMIGIYDNPRYWDVGVNYSKLQISQSAAGLNSQRPAGTWTGKVQNWLRQKIDPLGTLPGLDEYLRTRRLTKGKVYKIEQAGRKVYQALKDTKDPKAIYDFLTTRGASAAGTIKDPNEWSNAVAAKAAINKIGQQLLDAGLLGQNALDAHGDRYLPRMYLKYLLDENDQNAIAMGLKPGDLGYLKRRRNIDEGVRQLILGEIKDPAFLSAKAMMVPGRDLALLDWLGDIAQNPDWVLQNNITRWDTLGEMRKLTSDPTLISELQLRDTEGKAVTGYWLKNEAQRLTDQILPTLEDGSPKEKLLLRLIKRMNKRGNEVLGQEIVPDGWKKVPNTKRYGDLRGMVIRKEIYDDILGGFKTATGDESFAEQVLGDTGAMGKFNRFFKWAKVSANPPSWVRNFVSNMILMNLSGVPMYRLPGLFISAVREMKNKGKYYDVAERNGLIAGTFSNVELGRIEREFTDLQRRMKRGDRHPMNWVSQVQGAMNWTRDKTGDWYGGIDTFGKIMMVKHAMEKGMDEASAVANAEKWLFDYSLVKPSVRYLRNAAMGAPFITFTSKVAPLLLETIATKPWRFAPYYALGWAMTEMFKDNNDLDDEQLEGLKTALVPYLREKAAAGNVVPLPWLDDNGKVQFFDLSYLFPWGMFSEMAVELYEGNPTDAMKTMGMMGGPMVSLAAAITTGIDPFTRRNIANELDTPSQQAADWMWYYYNLAVPPWMHADFGVGKRVYEAMTGELTPEGEQRFTIPQALARVGGMNVTPIDPVTSRQKSIRSMQSDILKLTRDRNRNIRERIKMKQSKKEINEARQEFNERIIERRKELREFIKKTKVPEQLKRAG